MRCTRAAPNLLCPDTPESTSGPQKKKKTRQEHSPERTSDQQQTALQLVEEHDSLSSESAGEEDEDGTGGDGRSKLGLLGYLSGNLGLSNIVTRVVGLGHLSGSTVSGLAGVESQLGLGRLREGGGGGGHLGKKRKK